MTGGNHLFASRKGPNKKSMFRKGPNEVSKAWKKTKITKKKMYAALLFFRFKHGYLSFDFSLSFQKLVSFGHQYFDTLGI